MAATYRVYVLQNIRGSFYIGFSGNVPARVEQHNAGVTRSTCNKGPWRLVWQSEALGVVEARMLERELERQKRGNGFYQRTGLERS